MRRGKWSGKDVERKEREARERERWLCVGKVGQDRERYGPIGGHGPSCATQRARPSWTPVADRRLSFSLRATVAEWAHTSRNTEYRYFLLAISSVIRFAGFRLAESVVWSDCLSSLVTLCERRHLLPRVGLAPKQDVRSSSRAQQQHSAVLCVFHVRKRIGQSPTNHLRRRPDFPSCQLVPVGKRPRIVRN